MDELVDDEDTAHVTHGLWRAMWTWLPVLLLILSVRTYAVEPYAIPSGSMAPTLEIGDRIVVEKVSYGLWVPATGVDVPFLGSVWVAPRYELFDWGDPGRGDIIVFRYPEDESVTYIKRVVGLAGDRIAVEGHRVILNGEPVEWTSEGPYAYIDPQCQSHASRRYGEGGEVPHEVLTRSGLQGGLADWPASGTPIVVPEGSVFVMGDNRDHSADSRVWGFVREDQITGKARFVAFSLDSCGPRARGERFLRSLYR
jgi:signal peptidase I